jgi:nucleoside-diphosphate-sugar epimerase
MWVYGPLGTHDGGREKAPAAMCRKVACAPNPGEIEVWGDGKQTRSFMYIDDCVEGIPRIMRPNYREPLNLGTDELVSVDELAEIVIAASEKKIALVHDVTKPQGVRGRNSDDTLLREVLQWEPQMTLRKGMVPTYHWIAGQIAAAASVEKIVTDAAVAAA